MTRYLILNTIFLGMTIVVLRPWRYQRIRGSFWSTLAIVLALTALFDSLIILVQIVGYNSDHILGLYVWRAPVEDFFYAVASVVLVCTLWEQYDKND